MDLTKQWKTVVNTVAKNDVARKNKQEEDESLNVETVVHPEQNTGVHGDTTKVAKDTNNETDHTHSTFVDDILEINLNITYSGSCLWDSEEVVLEKVIKHQGNNS